MVFAAAAAPSSTLHVFCCLSHLTCLEVSLQPMRVMLQPCWRIEKLPILPFLEQHTGLWSVCFKSRSTWMYIIQIYRAPRYRSCKKKATGALVIRRSQGLVPKGRCFFCLHRVRSIPRSSVHKSLYFCHLGTATLGLTGLSFCSLTPKGLSSRC